MNDAPTSFDPYRIIRSRLRDTWQATQNGDGIETRRAAPVGYPQVIGTVRPDPERPWKCAPLDVNGSVLGPAVSPSEAAEKVSRHHLDRRQGPLPRHRGEALQGSVPRPDEEHLPGAAHAWHEGLPGVHQRQGDAGLLPEPDGVTAGCADPMRSSRTCEEAQTTRAPSLDHRSPMDQAYSPSPVSTNVFRSLRASGQPPPPFST